MSEQRKAESSAEKVRSGTAGVGDMSTDEYRIGDISQEEVGEDLDDLPTDFVQQIVNWRGVGGLRRRMGEGDGPTVAVANDPFLQSGAWATRWQDRNMLGVSEKIANRDTAGSVYRLLTDSGTVSAGDIGAELLQDAGVQEPDVSTDYEAVADRLGVEVEALPFINDGVVDPDRIGNWQGATTEASERKGERAAAREAAREVADDAGIDMDEYAVDATGGGDVIVQDRDTNRTERIEPDTGESGIDFAVESLASSSDSSTSNDTYNPDESASSGNTNSPGPSVDDLGSGRLAAAVAIGAAILYGVTQS
jgi:hypothetical protein